MPLQTACRVCSILHVAHVYVRRVIHVIVHNGLTVVEGVLVVGHHFYVAIYRSHLFVNCCIRRYCLYRLKRRRLSGLHLSLAKLSWKSCGRAPLTGCCCRAAQTCETRTCNCTLAIRIRKLRAVRKSDHCHFLSTGRNCRLCASSQVRHLGDDDQV